MSNQVETTRTWCGDMTKRELRNQARYVFWLAVWMASFLGATFALKYGWVTGATTWVVALAPNAFGVAAVLAFLRFLRQADELQRKIQTESLGWAFGAGALFMIGYRLLERAGVPRIDSSDPLVVMMVAWAVAVIVLARRYS